MIRSQQEWVHKVRSALSVIALNTGRLEDSKLVSRVDTQSVNVENNGSTSVLNFKVAIRYREA